MIKGGYYMKARKIQDSKIAHASPCIREIWDWLLKECNHTETKVCKRGECLTSYKEIIEGLSWYIGWRKMTYKKHDCENTMKWLKKATMITTRKTTRGMFISVVNYDKYQDPKNYENLTEKTAKTTRKPQTSHTIHKNDKNVKNDKKNIAKETFAFSEQLLKMEQDSRHIQIIALYWKYKRFDFDNNEQYTASLRRDLKPASALKGYSNDRISEVMAYLDKIMTVKWTLFTIHKYIDEDLEFYGEKKKADYSSKY